MPSEPAVAKRREPDGVTVAPPRIRPPFTPEGLTTLQRTAGNRAVAQLIQRKGGGHPVAEALGMNTTAARAALGAHFDTVARWQMNDLYDVLAHATPVPLLIALATNFAAETSARVQRLLNRLATPLTVATTVTLTPAEADLLETYAADAQAAYGVLTATGRNLAHTTGALPVLQPYFAQPVTLAFAQQELAVMGWDAAQAAPVLRYLVPYAQNPVALPMARQELTTAGGDIAKAAAEMTVLARYHYRRDLRAKAETRGTAAAEAGYRRGVGQAGERKQQGYEAAEVAATDAAAQIKVPKEPEPKTGNRATPTYKANVKKYTEAKQRAEDAATEARTPLREAAEEQERLDIEAAKTAMPETARQERTAIELWIDQATQALDADLADWLIERAAMRTDIATVLQTFVSGLRTELTAAKVIAAWAATYLDERPKLDRALVLGRAAHTATVPADEIVTVASLLMGLTISDDVLARLLAVAARDTAGWPAVATFIQTSFAKATESAADVLETAHGESVPLATFAPFGREAAVFLTFVHDRPALFLRRATWLQQQVTAKVGTLRNLCQLQADMENLADTKVDTLVTTCGKQIASLQTIPAAYTHFIAAAAVIPDAQLAAEIEWYEAWFVTHNQSVANATTVLTSFPSLDERGQLIVWLAHDDLRAALIRLKAANRAAAIWQQVISWVGYATSTTSMDALADAIDRIERTYTAPNQADDAKALYKLIHDARVGSAPRAISYGLRQQAPKAFVEWMVATAPNVESADYFMAHKNAWHEYLCRTPSEVSNTTIFVDRQKLAARSGSQTDWLHIFRVTFTLTRGRGTVNAELHNHVSSATNTQTSMHFKNDREKGRDLPSSLAIAGLCEVEVRAHGDFRNEPNKFPRGYKL